MTISILHKVPAAALGAVALLALSLSALAQAEPRTRPASHSGVHALLGHHRHTRHKKRRRPNSASRRHATAGTVVHVYETTWNLRYALTRMKTHTFVAQPDRGASVLTVNDEVRYQSITGFGAAMTDSSAWLLDDELSPDARAQTMSALFSPSGIHLNFVRIPMGASDFTANGTPYSYDDLGPGQSDPTLAQFSIVHDQPYVLPALRLMRQDNPGVQTLANPWSAPPWMKANGTFDNMRLAGTVFPQDYPALAQYFVKFIQAYQAAGVPIDAITPMNEPRSSSAWPGTALTPDAEAPFVTQDLVPALVGAGLHPKIYGLDDTELPDAQTLLQGPAGPALAGTAFHCYAGMGTMSTLHAEYPSKDIIMDECSPGIIPYAPAEAAIDATRNWASAVQLWNLALDPAGNPVQPPNYGCRACTGVVTVNEATHTTIYGRNYYELGQVSKFVQPGAVRIDSQRLVSDFVSSTGFGVTAGLDDVAFLNPDGSKVLVAYNNSRVSQPFALEYHGKYLSYSLPPAGTATFIWH